MSVSGIGSNAGFAMSLFSAGSTPSKPAAGASGAPTNDDPNDPLQFLTKYLNESPAKRMEDAWLAKHHLSEQQLASMPPEQQSAIRKQMADDIKKQIQQKTGGLGGNANLTV
jgi:hypothetical protein